MRRTILAVIAGLLVWWLAFYASLTAFVLAWPALYEAARPALANGDFSRLTTPMWLLFLSMYLWVNPLAGGGRGAHRQDAPRPVDRGRAHGLVRRLHALLHALEAATAVVQRARADLDSAVDVCGRALRPLIQDRAVKDKVCVITGGTDGIGKAAAHGLAARGARSCWFTDAIRTKGRAPWRSSRRAAAIPPSNSCQADFSLAGRRAAARRGDHGARTAYRRAREQRGRRSSAKRALSSDGYEMTFAVNHLAPFLLTHLLARRIEGQRHRSAHRHHGLARAPRRQAPRSTILQATRKFSPMSAYGTSKLANVLFTRALAKRLQGTAVTATCVHPGFVRTNFGRNAEVSPWFKALFGLVTRFARSPEKGAETVLYLAASPEVQRRLWRVLLRLQAHAPVASGARRRCRGTPLARQRAARRHRAKLDGRRVARRPP